MANFTAADVKELREFTGAGMLDVKNALDEADGDKKRAIEIIRVKGLKGLAKREDRETSEGLVDTKIDGQNGYMIELNCETDFVAKSPKFIELAAKVIEAIAKSDAHSAETALPHVQDIINETAATLGEKVVLKNVAHITAPKITVYAHKHSKELPPYLGVMLGSSDSDADALTQLSQHIAGVNPQYNEISDVPQEVLDSEIRVATEIAQKEGKPEAIIQKIVDGRLKSFYASTVLFEQPLVQNPDTKVKDLVAKNSIEISSYARLAIGEKPLEFSK